MQRQTTFLKKDDVKPEWHLVDAEGKVLGRLASELAVILMGKHKPTYTPHVDTGDFVVVINAKDIVLTGRKAEQKVLKSYSRYPGGLKQVPYARVLEKRPELLIEKAVQRMLPKGHLGTAMLKKLKVYSGADHPHQAQAPRPLNVAG